MSKPFDVIVIGSGFGGAVTAFGKSCQKLEIGIIRAYSPQAKGRVERRNGLYQDRPRLGS